MRASVNAPRAWPKSSLSSRLSGIAAQLSATNGARPAARVVERARDELLARAGLAADEHRRVACDAMRAIISYTRCIARLEPKTSGCGRISMARSSRRDLVRQAALLERARDRELQQLGSKGLVTKSYAPTRIASTAASSVAWPVTTITGRFGPRAEHALAQLETSEPLHREIREDDVDVASRDDVERVVRHRHGRDGVTVSFECRLQQRSLHGLVVDDQDPTPKIAQSSIAACGWFSQRKL